MKKTITLLFFLSLLGCAMQAQTPTYYVPDDYPTLQAALDAVTGGGTVVLRSGVYYGNRAYGTSRSASILIDGNADITIIGEHGAVITYDPANPPAFYSEVGPVVIIRNTGRTTINGVHVIGTRALGDPLYDLDVCIYQIATAPLTVINSDLSECGHAGVKHGTYSARVPVLFENNRCYDIGFTSRDHCVYFPGGGDYTIRNNRAWDVSGGCIGIGTGTWTDGGVVENNTCINNGYGVWSPYGQGAVIRNNFAMGSKYYDLGIFGGGHTFENNTVGTIYSERSCGAVVTNWCASPVPNVFFDMGNLYESISHPERIE